MTEVFVLFHCAPRPPYWDETEAAWTATEAAMYLEDMAWAVLCSSWRLRLKMRELAGKWLEALRCFLVLIIRLVLTGRSWLSSTIVSEVFSWPITVSSLSSATTSGGGRSRLVRSSLEAEWVIGIVSSLGTKGGMWILESSGPGNKKKFD